MKRFIYLQERHQLQEEGTDWLAYCFWGVLLGALFIGSVAGHAYISAGM